MGYAHGREWTDELTAFEITRVINELGVDRMPTNSECMRITGSHALSNRISKTLGFIGWAKKLNLCSKVSSSTKGWKYEEICIRDIEQFLSWEGELTPVKSPYDIKTKNVRIDVKMSNLFYSETQDYCSYTFNINDGNCGSDFYVFYCVDKSKIQKTYVIPSKYLSDKKQFTVGINKSKYDKFLNRWDLISDYNEILKNWIEKL